MGVEGHPGAKKDGAPPAFSQASKSAPPVDDKTGEVQKSHSSQKKIKEQEGSDGKTLKEVAQEHPENTDPVSLKVERSDTEPTDQDKGHKGKVGGLKGEGDNPKGTNKSKL